MPSGRAVTVRTARRHDIPGLVELRIRYLAEVARLEPRFELLADVRERTEHALPVWIEQEERVLLVAEPEAPKEGASLPWGYATGVATVWPPILREQHVGEVSELYVLPEERGKGIGRRLLHVLSDALRGLRSNVLRAPIPERSAESLARFRAEGYAPLQFVMERSLQEL